MLICGLAFYFWCDLFLLFTGGLSSWDDARGLGIFIGGIIAPIVTFLGLDLASQRIRGQDRQTHELQKQNLAHDEEKPITRLCQALDLIEQDAKTKRIVGLALLRQPDLSKEQSNLEAAQSALKSFIEEKGTINENDEDGEPKDSLWDELESTEAFKSLLYLFNLSIKTGRKTWNILSKANFNWIKIDNHTVEVNLLLFDCTFINARFSNISFSTFEFFFCDFSEAQFQDFSFDRVKFVGCNFSGTVFQTDHAHDFESLLNACWYFISDPPTVPNGTLLPIPHIKDNEHQVEGRKISSEEAKSLNHPDLTPRYNNNGEFVGMLFEKSKDKETSS